MGEFSEFCTNSGPFGIGFYRNRLFVVRIRAGRSPPQYVPRGTYSFYWLYLHVDSIINSKVFENNFRLSFRAQSLCRQSNAGDPSFSCSLQKGWDTTNPCLTTLILVRPSICGTRLPGRADGRALRQRPQVWLRQRAPRPPWPA